MVPDQTYSFEGVLWRSAGAGASWIFITVPADISQQIRFLQGTPKGFGSIRVSCSTGASRWNTSLFPDKASGCYFLPVRAGVRKAEAISTGDSVVIDLEIG